MSARRAELSMHLLPGLSPLLPIAALLLLPAGLMGAPGSPSLPIQSCGLVLAGAGVATEGHLGSFHTRHRRIHPVCDPVRVLLGKREKTR